MKCCGLLVAGPAVVAEAPAALRMAARLKAVDAAPVAQAEED